MIGLGRHGHGMEACIRAHIGRDQLVENAFTLDRIDLSIGCDIDHTVGYQNNMGRPGIGRIVKIEGSVFQRTT